MGVVCKICNSGCQGCGRKCKCWYNANMIGTVNSLYDLGMDANLIHTNINDIYNKRRTYSALEMYDYYVNGIALPEREKKSTVMFTNNSYINTVKNFVPKENPNPQCCYIKPWEEGKQISVRDRCIYCNEIKHYHKGNCSMYNNLNNKEKDNNG